MIAEAKLRGLKVTFKSAQDYIDWLAVNPRLVEDKSTHQQAEAILSVVSVDPDGETGAMTALENVGSGGYDSTCSYDRESDSKYSNDGEGEQESDEGSISGGSVDGFDS